MNRDTPIRPTRAGSGAAGRRTHGSARRRFGRACARGSWILGVASTLLGADPAAPEPASKPLLTRIDRIRGLSRVEAERQYPVRVQGVVTCFDRRMGLFFVQDSTAGVFVWVASPDSALTNGVAVAVEGYSGAGRFSPIINATSVKNLGRGSAPTPLPVGINDVLSGTEDAQWVEVNGIVHGETEDWGNWIWDLISSGRRLKVRILNHPAGAKTPFTDARVSARGVAGAQFDENGNVSGFVLFVPDASDVTVLEPSSGDPFRADVQPVRSLADFSPSSRFGHRVHLRGVVTVQRLGRLVVIKDATRPLQVYSRQMTVVEPGDIVDVVGFPVHGETGPYLQDASFRKLSVGPPPIPVPISVEQAVGGKYGNELVQIEARLLEAGPQRPGTRGFLFQSGNRTFEASLRVSESQLLPEIEPGSWVRVTGVCVLQPSDDPSRRSFRMWSRSPLDLEVVDRPPWWASARRRWVLRAGLAVGVASLFWLGLLRFRIARDVTERKQAEEALRLSEQQLRRSLQEQERIARDLHDGVIQSVYAVGLALEDCRKLIPREPAEAQTRLTRCRANLNALIQDLRSFIRGLEPEAIRGRELEAALKSLVLTMGQSPSTRFLLHVDPVAADRLNPKQATQLLHVAREATSNSLRHAQAKSTVVSLQVQDGCTRLEIKDDGIGFDMKNADESGHGLRNIAARARELHARLEITSSPGSGTCVALELPRHSDL